MAFYYRADSSELRVLYSSSLVFLWWNKPVLIMLYVEAFIG